jgi:hypothetical protein
LPTRHVDQKRDRFFIVAFTDKKGASSLANRIRQQAERIPHLRMAGVTLSVTYRMLAPFPTDGDASVDHLVGRMAANLEEAIEMAISTETGVQ